MEILWITIGIFVLYLRTLSYFFMIDDNVRRWGYLYCVPTTSPPHTFYNSKPSPWRHLWLIITHAINCFIINAIWGWKAAALFAFHPLSVTCTAWITGGYYSVTTLFTLTAYFFITKFHILGGLLGSFFFTAALGSTITCLGFPFIFLFQEHQGLLCFWPLLTYLGGKRFLTGFAIRNDGRKDIITYRKLAVMPKVIAHYVLMALVPYKLGFFRQFGFEYSRSPRMRGEVEAFNFELVLSVALLVLFGLWGWQTNHLGVLWFFCLIGPFCQFKMLGQFVAERYSYLPNVGIAVLLASAIGDHPILLTIVLTLYIYRSHLYIPAYRHMENLYLDGMRNYPLCVTNYANLAELYLQSGKHLKAYEMMEKGFAIDPDCFLLHCNMGAYWIQVNHLDRGLLHTELAVKNHTDTEDNAAIIMQKQADDLKRIIANRQKEYDRLDDEAAKQEEYDRVNVLACEEAKRVTKKEYATAS